MLLQLRDYLIEKQTANIGDIAWHFKQSPDTVRCWVMHWLQKGKVSRVQQVAGCQIKCRACQPQQVEVYCWTG